jgi:hypothetical protein
VSNRVDNGEAVGYIVCMIRRSSFFLLIVMAVGACSEDERVTDSRARVSFVMDSLVTMEAVYATLDDGASVWDFKPENFRQSTADSVLYLGPEVQTRSDGTLNMSFRLFKPNDQLFSDGTVALPLSPNWRWNLEIVHSVDNPSLGCDDCWGVSEFDIYDQQHAGESVWVVWRGRGP